MMRRIAEAWRPVSLHHRVRDAVVAAWASVLIAMSATPAYAEPLELFSQVDGDFVELNVAVDFTDQNAEFRPAQNLWWFGEYSNRGSDYLRLVFSGIQAGSTDFNISFFNRDGETIEQVEGIVFTESNDFVSLLMPGNYVLMAVFADSRPDLKFRIDGMLVQLPAGGVLSITEPDNRERMALYKDDPVIMAASKPVAKLSFSKNGKPHVCSGFLISEDRLMTNHHCVSTAATCHSTAVLFDFEFLSGGARTRGDQYRCARVVKADYHRDFAVLELTGTPGTKWGKLAFAAADAAADQDVMIIQHPAGQPKQISRIGCKVTDAVAEGRAPESDFAHVCDTYGGSSGAPVLDEAGQVVGLHHYGFGSRLYWTKNRAIRISKIREVYDLP